MQRLTLICIALGLMILISPETGRSELPPIASIRDFLKPKIYQSVSREHEVVASATLNDAERKEFKDYSFFTAFKTSGSPKKTREVLTRYDLFEKMIPFVDHSRYNLETKVVDIAGGLWGYRLRSEIQMKEKGDREVQFQVLNGHFRGMEGQIVFEPAEKAGTLVMMRGQLSAAAGSFPPAFVLERGAEFVFTLAGKKMRSLIESKEELRGMHDTNTEGPDQQTRKHSGGAELPQPRGTIERSRQ